MATKIDSENMYGALKEIYKQVMVGYNLPEKIKVEGEINKILIAGMGGSGLGGEILKSYLADSKIPVFTCKDYTLPNFVDDKTLIFVVSYSGNTEETLEIYKQVFDRRLKAVVLAHGGALETATGKNPFIKVPETIQPRMSYCYQFFSMLRVLENSGLIGYHKVLVEKLSEKMKALDWDKKAQEIAKQLHKKIPLIYSSEKLRAAGYKWKINVNENAKTMAFANVFPEHNHNEINGMIHPEGNFIMVFLKDSADHKMVRKRMDVVEKLAMQNKIKSISIEAEGSNSLEKLITTIYLGDLVSYFLALEYGIDPTPVELIEGFKKMLKM